MNRLIGVIILLFGLMMILGVDISHFSHFVIAIFILYGAYHLILRQRLPSQFGVNILLLVFGPLLILCIGYTILSSFNELHPSEMVVLFLLLVGIILIWTFKIKNKAGIQKDSKQLRGHEREFIAPFHDDTDQEHERSSEDE